MVLPRPLHGVGRRGRGQRLAGGDVFDGVRDGDGDRWGPHAIKMATEEEKKNGRQQRAIEGGGGRGGGGGGRRRTRNSSSYVYGEEWRGSGRISQSRGDRER